MLKQCVRRACLPVFFSIPAKLSSTKRKQNFVPKRFHKKAVGEKREVKRQSSLPLPMLISAEDVSLFSVALPVRGRKQRQLAAAYALEEKIAVDLEVVHVIVGPVLDVDKSLFLVAVVSKAKMSDALNAAAPDQPIYCEQLTLPAVIEEGDEVGWAVTYNKGRVLVRKSDSTGFASSLKLFEVHWRRSNCPKLFSYGKNMPEGYGDSNSPKLPEPDFFNFDLRPDGYGVSSVKIKKTLIRMGFIAVVGLVCNIGMLKTDVLALSKIAEQEINAAQKAISPYLPGHKVNADTLTLLNKVFGETTTLQPDVFLSFYSGISEALIESSASISFDRLEFDAKSQLLINIQAESFEALQNVEATLLDNGFSVSSGAATVVNGNTQTQLQIQVPK